MNAAGFISSCNFSTRARAHVYCIPRQTETVVKMQKIRSRINLKLAGALAALSRGGQTASGKSDSARGLLDYTGAMTRPTGETFAINRPECIGARAAPRRGMRSERDVCVYSDVKYVIAN